MNLPGTLQLKLIGGAILALVLAGAIFQVNVWRSRAIERDAAIVARDQAQADLTAYAKNIAARDKAAAARQAADAAAAAAVSGQLASLRDQTAKLLQASARIPLVQTHEVPPNESGHCTVIVRSSAYRVCVDAAWSRDPAAAAACQASGSHAAGGLTVSAAGSL